MKWISGVAAALLFAGSAQALEMKISGHTISLSGSIENGDEFRFKDMLASPAGQAVKVVRVNSDGGFVNAAGEIGRLIRKRGLATLLDAGSARCASACTLLFAAGASRHYVGAGAMQDGVISPKGYRGLAFHEGSAPLSRASNKYSGAATADMIGWYYEFGVSAAKDFITKAPPERLYALSGATALSSGIATSLTKP